MACSGLSVFRLRALSNAMTLNRLLGQGSCGCGVNLQFVRFKVQKKQRVRQPHQVETGTRSNKRMETMERKSYEAEEMFSPDFLSRVPQDDVWLQAEYPVRESSFLQALAMHREFCQPQMFDAMDALVRFEADLDFRTRKKTKFMVNVKNTVVLPHQFDDGTENSIVAICKTQEEKEKAEAAGAFIAGGVEVVKALEKKEIRFEDFNHVVCTTEMLGELALVRKILRDQFPHKKLGTVSDEITSLVTHFSNGKNYESKKIREDTGRVVVNIGRLDMVDELLVKNFEFYLEELCKHRKIALGNFIKLGKISVLPSTGEVFHLLAEEVVPPSQRKVEIITEEQEEEEVVEVDSDDEKAADTVTAR